MSEPEAPAPSGGEVAKPADALNWEFRAAKYRDFNNPDQTMDRTSATDFFNQTNGLGSPEYYAEKRIKELEEKENKNRRVTRSQSKANQESAVSAPKPVDYVTKQKQLEELKKKFTRRSNQPVIVPERTDAKKSRNFDSRPSRPALQTSAPGNGAPTASRPRGVSPAPRSARGVSPVNGISGLNPRSSRSTAAAPPVKPLPKAEPKAPAQVEPKKPDPPAPSEKSTSSTQVTTRSRRSSSVTSTENLDNLPKRPLFPRSKSMERDNQRAPKLPPHPLQVANSTSQPAARVGTSSTRPAKPPIVVKPPTSRPPPTSSISRPSPAPAVRNVLNRPAKLASGPTSSTAQVKAPPKTRAPANLPDPSARRRSFMEPTEASRRRSVIPIAVKKSGK